VLASLLGWAVASVFLHLAHYRTLGTLLALSACIAAAPVAGVRQAAPGGGRRPVAAALTALVAVTAGLGVVAATPTTSYTAIRTLTLVPPGPVDGNYLRGLLARDRTEVLPTYAALIAPAGSGGRAEADPTRGVITVSSSAPDMAQARADLSELLVGGTERLAATGASRAYELHQLGADTEAVRHDVSAAGIGLGALVAAGVGLFGALLSRTWRQRSCSRRRRPRGRRRGPGAEPSGAHAEPSDTVVLVEFSPSGGLFQYAVQLGESLAAQGRRVEVLTGPDPELAARHPNLRIRAVLPTWHPTNERWGPAAARRPVRALQLVSAWVVLTWRLVRRPPRAVLFSNWRFSFEPLFVVWITRLLRGRSLVGIVAHEPLPRSDRRDTATPKSGRLLEWAFGAAWRRMDVVFALGAHSAAVIRQRWAPPCEPVVIPHGDEYALRGGHPITPVTETAPVALFFGTWTRYKGLDVLLDAFERVRGALPGARLVLAGVVGTDLDPAAVLTRAAAIGGVDARPGYLDIAEVPAMVGSARLLVTPYVRASQSGVVHLAHTFGRPVISSAVGDIPEVVHHRVNGLLVPPSDAQRLAEAMIELLGDAELAARLGAAGASELATAWHVAASRVGAALDAAG
jgi:glycosyltransferase involved in cell wall biosynthesis